MEKERYELQEVENELDLNDTDVVVVDNEKGGIIRFNNICKLLNRQDSKIKELEEENKNLEYARQLGYKALMGCEDDYQALKQENQQLKQSENQKAIEELEKIINLFEPYENDCKDTILCANNGISFIEYTDNRIKELKDE